MKTAPVERRRRYSLPRGEGDDSEGARHQHVPLPPGRTPVAAEGDRGHRLRQQCEGNGDGKRHGRRLPPVEEEVANRCVPVQRDSEAGERVERPVGLGRGECAIEGRQPGQRVGGPAGQQHEHPSSQERLPSHDCGRVLGGQVERRGGREYAREQEPDRRRDDEARVGALQQHAGRGQRVEAEEAGARHERERDEEEPRVSQATGRLPGEVAEHEADERRDQDEPEMGRVVLPVGVRLRTGQQQREPGQRECQWKEPAGHGRRSP